MGLGLKLLIPNLEIVHMYDVEDKRNKTTKDLFNQFGNQVKYFTSLEELDDDYDIVFSNQTLEHIEDYDVALHLISKFVKVNGYLYIDVPYFNQKANKHISFSLMRREIIRQYMKHEHYHLGFVSDDFVKHLKNFSLLKESFYSTRNEDRNYKTYLSMENTFMQNFEIDLMWQKFIKEHQDTLNSISSDQAFKRPYNQKLVDAIIVIFKRDNK